MSDDAALLFRGLSWFGRSVGHSAALFESFATVELGFALPDAVLQAPSVVAARDAARAAAVASAAGANRLDNGVAAGNDGDIVGGILELTNATGRFFQGVGQLENAVTGAISPATVPDAVQRAAASAFVSGFRKKLADHILASGFTDEMPVVAFYLKLLGLMEWRRHFPPPGTPFAEVFVERGLRLNRIKALITDPITHLRDSHRWGQADFDPEDLFELFAGFFPDEAHIETGRVGADAFLQYDIFRISRDSTVNPPGLRLALMPRATPAFDERVEISDAWGFGIKSDLTLSGTVSGSIKPPFAVALQTPSGQITGQLRLAYNRNPSAQPYDILGGGGLINLTATDTAVGLALRAQTDGAGARIEPMLFADVTGATLRLGTAGADNFLANLLAGANIEGSFDLSLELRPTEGLVVKASGGIEVALPIHKSLGPVEFETVFIGLRIKPDGTFGLELSTLVTGHLGPLTASVERMGVMVDLAFTDQPDATFGPVSASPYFKPPIGIGLSIDAGVIKGGGYLFLDVDRGEYAGALELTFSGFLSLKAIGILTTRMPDGSDGFSLLVIITAEFGTGIQLGFGFTLLGVGGLLGLNRTMLLQSLMEGVRSGAVNDFMFPRDIVANAARIISDLRTIFPPQDGTFLIGPMAKLGWGTPTLVSLSLGIIMEIPGNIAIVGVLKLALPAEDAPLILLQVSFAGAIEFDKNRMYFFASLFQSRVLFLTIDGDMGLLAAFGDDANFVLSVGGFHPQFRPPPLPFPIPTRISITILNESFARIRLEGYFAVTSNTAQFGARAEVFFGFSAFKVEGSIAFDALLQFSPLHFIVQISSHFSIKVFGVGVFGIGIRLSLEGPGRWRAQGTATLSLLFFDIDVDLDQSWGETADTALPPITVLPLLAAEIDKLDNWRALPPPTGQLLVSLRRLDATKDGLVLHPVGVLRVVQKKVPLNVTIAKFGNQKVADAKRMSLAVAPGGFAKAGDPQASFAPAQFNDFSDDQKLTQQPFEDEDAGLDLAPSGQVLYSGHAIKRVVRFELLTIDTGYRRFLRRYWRLSGIFLARFLNGGSIALSSLSTQSKAQKVPFKDKVTVGSESFVVVHTDTNKPFAANSNLTSEQKARDQLNDALAADPSLTGKLHVVPAFEMAA